MIKFFWMPNEVWYYAIIPIIIVLLFYGIFNLFYKKKKDTYYYDFVVDYVYSTCGIIFCSLLFCLLFGYGIATIELLIKTNLIAKHILLTIVVSILPIIPASFLVYIIKIYLNNLKRKNNLDSEEDKKESNIEKVELVKK